MKKTNKVVSKVSVITLDIDQYNYSRILEDDKRFIIVDNDSYEFQKGDVLTLREVTYELVDNCPTGRYLVVTLCHVTTHNLKDGYAALGFTLVSFM